MRWGEGRESFDRNAISHCWWLRKHFFLLFYAQIITQFNSFEGVHSIVESVFTHNRRRIFQAICCELLPLLPFFHFRLLPAPLPQNTKFLFSLFSLYDCKIYLKVGLGGKSSKKRYEEWIEAPAIVAFTWIQHRIQFSFIIKPLISFLALHIIRCILNTFENLLWIAPNEIESATTLVSCYD